MRQIYVEDGGNEIISNIRTGPPTHDRRVIPTATAAAADDEPVERLQRHKARRADVLPMPGKRATGQLI